MGDVGDDVFADVVDDVSVHAPLLARQIIEDGGQRVRRVLASDHASPAVVPLHPNVTVEEVVNKEDAVATRLPCVVDGTA